MVRFNFLDIKPPNLDSAYGNALRGEEARAATQGAWAEALASAVEKETARNDKRQALIAEANLRRELAARAEAGALDRARLQDAGEERRSARFVGSQEAARAENVRQFELQRGDQQAALARTQEGQEALGSLMTGQGQPLIGPPADAAPGFVGPPNPNPQGSTLDRATMISKLPPQVAMQYMQLDEMDQKRQADAAKAQMDYGFKLKQHEDEMALKREQATAKATADTTKAASSAKPEASPFERAVDIVSKMPAFKKPADVFDADGIKTGTESPEAFHARYNAEVERVMNRLAGAELPPDEPAPEPAPEASTMSGQKLLGRELTNEQAKFVNHRDGNPVYKLWDWITGNGEKPEGATPQHEAIKRAKALKATDPQGALKILREAGFNSPDEIRAALGSR